MYKSVKGIYRDGKVELSEKPEDITEEARVIVVFLEQGPTDLKARGIDEAMAVELRSRLAPFASEWDDPEMDAYDRYDDAKARL